MIASPSDAVAFQSGCAGGGIGRKSVSAILPIVRILSDRSDRGCTVRIELDEMPLFCAVIQQANSDEPTFVIGKTELSDVALQGLVVFGLFLALLLIGQWTETEGWRKPSVQETERLGVSVWPEQPRRLAAAET